MPIQILTTKLNIPPAQPQIVARPHLLARLDADLHTKLTLLSAPAGFGKTTLVSTWLSAGKSAIAWVSLDTSDSDPARFLAYLVAALQRAAPELGQTVQNALQSPHPPIESILTVLLNELSLCADQVILVLDDYHVLDAPAIDAALTFLLEHLPPQLHLVITTREDPPLPLARLRARGQMTELRAADLRFSPAEAAIFLNQVMGLHLDPDQIAALETRTEGWIAGLQLAALSMQGRQDVASFIRAFAGHSRYIVDYLVDEVLQRQPAPLRNFLLQTAILDRLCDDLCQAVVAPENGAAGQAKTVRLEELERANLFVLPLDDRRAWYRYHHLFADVLRAHLQQEQGELVPLLHRRAACWLADHHSPAAAIHHALAGEDFAYAAELIELAWRAMDRNLESAAWLRWVLALPAEIVRARPVLGMGCAWAHLTVGELETGAAFLHDAERLLGTAKQATTGEDTAPAADSIIVSNHAEFRLLPASIAAAHAFLAQAHGDTSASMAYARQALDLYPAANEADRAVPAAILGLAQWGAGDLKAAHASLAAAMNSFQRSGDIVAALSGTYGLADIRITQGQLRAAVATYKAALQLAMEQGDPPPRGTADIHLGLADLYREQGDLGAAQRELQRSQELGADAALADWPHRARVVYARILQAQGDLAGAFAQLDAAAALYYRTPVPDTRPIAALKVRVWLAQGRLLEALAWAQNLAVDDGLSFLHEFEDITRAQVLLVQHQQTGEETPLRAALHLLERRLQAAAEGGRVGSVIEIRVLQALAYGAQNDTPTAAAALARALTLAEPEGYVRVFVDTGPALAPLLQAAANLQGAPDYRFSANYVQTLAAQTLARPFGATPNLPPTRASASQALPEPLSARELDVLRLLGSELSGPQIAQELLVSLNTMRTHTKNIYAKLGVNNRRAAIKRATELGVF